ncbi:hypothetical protein ABT173_40210 [Streptomyces sp. NPDC001795]|uniref:hypothetical protein n=1 Tax=Streptomyces sp. NPDC001795 TaxID=3154525 RepID=UPI0033308CF3
MLQSLRGYLSMPRIRDATEVERNTFGDEYGLATHHIATDGLEIFAECADGEPARARDGQ